MRFVVTVVAAALLLAGCTSPAEPASPTPSPAAACGSPVGTDALPSWALGGFSGDGSGNPHVLGAHGDILAVLFGFPLASPPDDQRSNKILWVSRLPVDGDPLVITATPDGGGEQVERQVAGGPGPSGIDLPRPGCWHLTLTWSGHTDTMDLVYRAG